MITFTQALTAYLLTFRIVSLNNWDNAGISLTNSEEELSHAED